VPLATFFPKHKIYANYMIQLLILAPAGYFILFLIVFSIWAALKINKRLGRKNGCVSIGYITLVVFCISLLSTGITWIMIRSASENLSATIGGSKYTAKITDYTSHKSTDGNTMYTPIFSFTTEEGQTLSHPAGYSSGEKPQIGQECTVYYNSRTNQISIWSASTLILIIGVLIMASVLLIAFYAIVRYALGYSMERFWKFLQKFASYVFLPVVMISFDALLIYALISKVDSFGVQCILFIFIFILTLAIWGYLKMTFQHGALKWKQTSYLSWSGDWDESNKNKNNQKDKSVNNKDKTNNYKKNY